MKKGSIEFSTRQVVMLILVIIILAIVIVLGVKYFDQIKAFITRLLGGASTFV